MGLVVVVLQATAIGRLTRRFGDVGTGIGGAAALMAGLLIVPFTQSRGALAAATCLMGAGQALCNPALTAYISKISPPTHRGAILGVSTSLNALARVIGPAAAGLAYDALHAPGALLSQAAIVTLGIVLSLRLIAKSAALPAAGAAQLVE
jgi:MFS family permease